jgi:integrase
LSLQPIETFMQRRLEDGAAPRTVNIQVSVVNRMMAWAEKQGIIPHNPIAQWQPLREVPRRMRRAMQPEEVQDLLAVAPLWRRIVYAVLLATGIRRGEMIHLERPDLDLERGVLVVRPELTKSGKGRRVFLPKGLVDLLREYLRADFRERLKRQDAFLDRVRRGLASLVEAGQDESKTAERLRYVEDVICRSRGHRYLFVNGKGLPIRRNANLLREFRKDLKKAGINPTGLDLHALRHTTNTTLLRGGVNPSIIRARLGHTTARMTETYTDKDALDQGGETEPIATLVGVSDDSPETSSEAESSTTGRRLTLETQEKLRPTGEVLAALVERYSNIVIARLCRVSEMAVRKWLKVNGITRTRRIISKEMTEIELALLRADLRAALATTEAQSKRSAV